MKLVDGIDHATFAVRDPEIHASDPAQRLIAERRNRPPGMCFCR